LPGGEAGQGDGWEDDLLVLGGNFAPVGPHDDGGKTTAASAVSIRDREWKRRDSRTRDVMDFGRIKWELVSEYGSKDDID
jgi:hypothetical protein